MSDTDNTDDKKPLSLKKPGRLELRKTVESGEVRQSFSHGRSKTVTVEVKRKRSFKPGKGGGMTEVRSASAAPSGARKTAAAEKVFAGMGVSKSDESRQPIVLK